MHQVVTERVAAAGRRRIGENSLLLINPSGVTKPYAEAMEYLARVRDGSKGELSNGHRLCQVVGVDCGGHQVTPTGQPFVEPEHAGFP